VPIGTASEEELPPSKENFAGKQQKLGKIFASALEIYGKVGYTKD
jgi:hypothetical protein